LAAGAETASEAETKKRDEFGQRAGAAANHDAETEMDYADSGVSGGLSGCLPLLAHFCEKPVTGGRGLFEDLVGSVAIDSSGGGYE
jgi:hypothetical protein